MNFERFVASKILGYKRYKNSISSPIIKISILSIIVGIVVMNISMSIGFGIQKNINEKFSNNVGDLIITNYVIIYLKLVTNRFEYFKLI